MSEALKDFDHAKSIFEEWLEKRGGANGEVYLYFSPKWSHGWIRRDDALVGCFDVTVDGVTDLDGVFEQTSSPATTE